MSKIAAIQMCSSSIVEKNLLSAARLIKKAASNGAKLIVLPEMFAIMGKDPKDKVIAKEHYGKGVIQSFLSQESQKNKIWLVGGTIPITCEDKNKVRAACIVYDDEGRSVARYDKIHLFDVTISEWESYKESDTTEAGDKLVVTDTPFGKLGLAVCYDLRFPNIFTALSNSGAEIIAVPSAFTVKTGAAHWSLLTRCRAIDSFSYIIGACQEGTHDNERKTYGHSIIVNPWGTVEHEQEEPGEGIVYSHVNLQKLHEIRKSIPTFQHRKKISDIQ